MEAILASALKLDNSAIYIKKMEQNDTKIYGILAHFRHFGHSFFIWHLLGYLRVYGAR
jgi:hypothetical protein